MSLWMVCKISHANGASFFFIVVYAHIFRGLYYGSYIYPRRLLWCSVLLFSYWWLSSCSSCSNTSTVRTNVLLSWVVMRFRVTTSFERISTSGCISWGMSQAIHLRNASTELGHLGSLLRSLLQVRRLSTQQVGCLSTRPWLVVLYLWLVSWERLWCLLFTVVDPWP